MNFVGSPWGPNVEAKIQQDGRVLVRGAKTILALEASFVLSAT
jgi:hypothetical protein